ncbi:MAG TPA: hypothetical protein VG317_05905, partial [Pseudonocardiaceae bacterium]|nr:hypothetical protein [Pseudonocardiaceae bacterium]
CSSRSVLLLGRNKNAREELLFYRDTPSVTLNCPHGRGILKSYFPNTFSIRFGLVAPTSCGGERGTALIELLCRHRQIAPRVPCNFEYTS